MENVPVFILEANFLKFRCIKHWVLLPSFQDVTNTWLFGTAMCRFVVFIQAGNLEKIISFFFKNCLSIAMSVILSFTADIPLNQFLTKALLCSETNLFLQNLLFLECLIWKLLSFDCPRFVREKCVLYPSKKVLTTS